MLTPSERLRYQRHLSLPEIGEEGQCRLKAARVLVVGAGGLGSPLGLYLAAAGVGHLGLVDHDRVEVSNLQRQVLFGHQDLGRRKAEAAAARLAEINPEIEVTPHAVTLQESNVVELLASYDLVVDGTDNFPTRYLVNDACVLAGKPNVYGSILRFEGQVSLFAPGRGGPCYRCLYPEPPPPGTVPSCAEGGVLGVLPGVVGALQALEAIKWIAGIGRPLLGRLLLFDALGLRFREYQTAADPDCLVCGPQATLREVKAISWGCQLPGSEIAPSELLARWRAGRRGRVIDVRERWEWEAGRLEELSPEWVPLGQLEQACQDWDRQAELILYCQSGQRSAQAQALLHAHGFTAAWSLTGGVRAWRSDLSVGFDAT